MSSLVDTSENRTSALETPSLLPSLSIIIPTRNRAGSLKLLLESLAEPSRRGMPETEIIVVDNGSTDETRRWLDAQREQNQSGRLIILNEPRPGKSNAINRALVVARGEILMVLDDDVVVESNCLAKHAEAHAQDQFAAIQGRILPGKDFAGNPADANRLREYNIPLIDYGEEIVAIRGLTGTNMSFKRVVFDKIGFFDPRLGPGAAGFSEDTEYSIRIRKAGFKIGYTPHAIVYHELNPSRSGRVYNRAVEYRKGVSRSLYRRDSILTKVLPDLFANCVRYAIYRLLGRHDKIYKTEGRILKCWGYLAGSLGRGARRVV
ncbi:MAG TPA: glycosyltransferase family 2 protein [Candidatus Binatia bacterium]|nr:glycosyltransferase family 2 protein [Candidatus Binatia bacterium]